MKFGMPRKFGIEPYLLVLVFLVNLGRVTEATLCYQCDSWLNLGCGEDDYLYEKEKEFLIPCSSFAYSQQQGQFQTAPHTCLKEVTYFYHDKDTPILDPYNRYNRPHVLRHCGISLNPTYTRGEDYYDRCVKTEAVVNGIRAERLICSCTGDGCNSAMSFTRTGINPLIILGPLTSLLLFFYNRNY